MLQIKNITAKVKEDGKVILDKFNLNIGDGETHVIMGPNGAGKSTLSKVIMGHYKYEVVSGDIIFNGKSIVDLEVSDRAKLGLFLSMQDPTVIPGIKNSEFLRTALQEVKGEKVNLFTFIKEMEKETALLNLDYNMLHRSLNEGFSGGEKKKNEVLQLAVLKPKFIILDELDSGLDVDSLKLSCKRIVEYLKENKDTSVLIITHYPKILDYIKPDYVHILSGGKIVKTGDISLASQIEENGYSGINIVNGNEDYE